MITRDQTLSLVNKYVQTNNSIKHMLATEAIMRSLAKHFNEDEEVWGLSGLLHDLDMEIVDYHLDPALHGVKTVEILKSEDIPQIVFDAILAHNEATGKSRNELIEKCIYSTDPITGLIVASALIRPERNLASLEVKSILKKFKNKQFAAGANRDIIMSCSEFKMELDDFIALSLKAMQSISDDLGL
ncbi:MAG: phosphohydrolase [Parcubacteria group bacterium CG1_02_37_51]|uniref:Phosphohydrolase n=2 Tax=Candidatus Komeiliibacteriota TaxID=1817908 RepID=A0A2M8DQP5_9BACT|nr:MAG: phosphohydrolase [Parcubacteria group bacterium CG1_02_37_51]PIY94540.1 MAG: phosphohydrolase [Candidatus Komeilibacteria bacterium CG_4_10_14_0_8_um_filter_37_78]PJC01469.1 MAG: phosphohydrolase [Candidatus Komeilibacteria bacterium CG_4_9_14_0_8_um_filter_36_9]